MMNLLRAGWAGVALFGLFVLVMHGSDELVFVVVMCGLSTLFLFLLRGRASRVTLAFAAVVGALFGLEQVAYLVGDVSHGLSGTMAVDALGLAAALAILVGTVAAWRSGAPTSEPARVAQPH